jgi:hypothetical protein
MARSLLIFATIVSILFGTGTFNVACLCAGAPGPPASDSAGRHAPSSCGTAACHGAPAPVLSGCCCAGEPQPAAPDERTPGPSAPDRCPCLYWTNVPLSAHDSATGPTLVKRALELTPVLLLEAVSTPLVLGTAVTSRAGPSGLRDLSIRLQAWHCVWTI